MSNKEAARKPAAAGFLVSAHILIMILIITSVITISFSGCASSSRVEPPRPSDDPDRSFGEVSDRTPQYSELQAGDLVVQKEKSVKTGVTLEGLNVTGKGRNEVEDLVTELARDVDREAKNAEINPENWNVSNSEEGVKVDVSKTVSLVMEAAEGSSVKMIVNTVQPSYSQKQLQDGIFLISQFTTTLVDRSSGRVNNIRIAAKHIDYCVVGPGKEFSFNKTVGKTTASEGYQKAIIIGKDNKREYEVGGGVCQLSTTLYNTADKAGLRITQRHPHTTKVSYINPGRDAMVNDGNADFRFVNSHDHPIMIRAEVGSTYVKTWILENRNEVGNER